MQGRCRRSPWLPRGLKMLDQAGVNQEPVEAPRLLAPGAGEELAVAAYQDALLLGKGRIERQARGLQNEERKIWTFKRIQRRGEIERFEIDGVDCVVGGEISRILRDDPLRDTG